MIIRNALNDVVKFKIGDTNYIHLQPMQECNLSLKSTTEVLELVNLSFANRRKTVITIMIFPIIFIIHIIASTIGADSFEYSYFYDLSHNEEDGIYIFEYDDEKNIVLKSENEIIENYGHSKMKSFIVFMLLSIYSVLVYLCIAFVIYIIFN